MRQFIRLIINRRDFIKKRNVDKRHFYAVSKRKTDKPVPDPKKKKRWNRGEYV